MKTYQLISTDPIQVLNVFKHPELGLPPKLELPDDREPPVLPTEYKYVQVMPDESFDEATQKLELQTNLERHGRVAVYLTQEELASKAAQDQYQAAHDAASAVFDSLSLGKQVFWESIRGTVGMAILSGDMARAKNILETVPALYPDAEADRAAFLALFP